MFTKLNRNNQTFTTFFALFFSFYSLFSMFSSMFKPRLPFLRENCFDKVWSINCNGQRLALMKCNCVSFEVAIKMKETQKKNRQKLNWNQALFNLLKMGTFFQMKLKSFISSIKNYKRETKNDFIHFQYLRFSRFSTESRHKMTCKFNIIFLFDSFDESNRETEKRKTFHFFTNFLSDHSKLNYFQQKKIKKNVYLMMSQSFQIFFF